MAEKVQSKPSVLTVLVKCLRSGISSRGSTTFKSFLKPGFFNHAEWFHILSHKVGYCMGYVLVRFGCFGVWNLYFLVCRDVAPARGGQHVASSRGWNHFRWLVGMVSPHSSQTRMLCFRSDLKNPKCCHTGESVGVFFFKSTTVLSTYIKNYIFYCINDVSITNLP